MGCGSVINVFGGAGNLDQIADGTTYRRVIGVDGNGQITAASIADGAIQSNHLASGSVTGNAIADGTIQPNHLGFSLGTPTLTDGCIQSNHIAAGAVQSWHITSQAVGTDQIADGSVNSSKTSGWNGTFAVDGASYSVSNGLITSGP
jgi:hypothetical protein